MNQQQGVSTLNTEPAWSSGPPERPLGVTLIAIREFLGAALYLVAGLCTIGDSPIASVIGIASAAIGLAVGMGLWNMRPWARVVTIAFAILSLVLTFFPSSIGRATFVGFILDIVVLIYLFQPHIRDLFQRPPLPY